MKKLLLLTVLLVPLVLQGCGMITKFSTYQQVSASSVAIEQYRDNFTKLLQKLPDKSNIDSPINAAYADDIAWVKREKCEAYYGGYNENTTGYQQYKSCIARLEYNNFNNNNNNNNEAKNLFQNVKGVNDDIIDGATKMYNILKYAANNIGHTRYATWVVSNDSVYSAAIVNSVTVPLYSVMLHTIWNNPNGILNSTTKEMILSNKQLCAIHLLYYMYNNNNYSIDNSTIDAYISMMLIFLNVDKKSVSSDDVDKILSKYVGNGWRHEMTSKDTSAQVYIIENSGMYSIEFISNMAKNKAIYDTINSILSK